MARASIDVVSSLVGKIYEAAYDPQSWFDVVKGVEGLFDGSRACVARSSSSDPRSNSAIASVVDPEFTSSKLAELHGDDPLFQTFAAMPVGIVCRGIDVHDEVAFRRRALWQDWFRPRDMYRGITCKLYSSADSGWFIDVQRGEKQQEFSRAEQKLFQRLAPHIIRAGEISRHFEQKSALADTFAHLPFGVLIVDRHRRILQMNEAAEALLIRPDSPLCAKGNVVTTTGAKDRQMLEQLVRDSCVTPVDPFPGVGGSMIVPSDHSSLQLARLVLSISPFLNAGAFGTRPERCAVIMTREVSLTHPAGFDKQLRSLFALTAAEAKIARCLASGLSLKQAAEENTIRFSTARSYLDKIFQKTGANKQGQLVALLKSVQPLRAD